MNFDQLACVLLGVLTVLVPAWIVLRRHLRTVLPPYLPPKSGEIAKARAKWGVVIHAGGDSAP